MTTEQFKSLILPLKNKLYRFALTYLSSAEDARDVVQDVMMKSWEEISDPNRIKNMEAWCITVTRNKSLDRLKKKGRNYLQVAKQHDLTTGEAGPHQRAEEKDAVLQIRDFVAVLPDLQREVITLRDMEGYSYKEIAEVMGIETGYVKVLLHRARTEVRKKLIKIHNYGTPHPQ